MALDRGHPARRGQKVSEASVAVLYTQYIIAGVPVHSAARLLSTEAMRSVKVACDCPRGSAGSAAITPLMPLLVLAATHPQDNA